MTVSAVADAVQGAIAAEERRQAQWQQAAAATRSQRSQLEAQHRRERLREKRELQLLKARPSATQPQTEHLRSEGSLAMITAPVSRSSSFELTPARVAFMRSMYAKLESPLQETPAGMRASTRVPELQNARRKLEMRLADLNRRAQGSSAARPCRETSSVVSQRTEATSATYAVGNAPSPQNHTALVPKLILRPP